MHGPGPGGGPRGGGYGGPRGGMGGPHGGMMGPHGGHGGMMGPHGRDYARPIPLRPAAKGTGAVIVESTGDIILEGIHLTEVNAAAIKKNSRLKTKIGRSIAGYFGAKRMAFTNPFHEGVFESKVAAADKKLENGEIPPLVCNYRKLKAASNYYVYLLKVGRINRREYRQLLDEYAETLKAGFEGKYYAAYVKVMNEESSYIHSR